ncbi:MAG TPA: carboxypeptidase-like regulatory domain-containing protein [Pyrinomonadaceae bacterium]
MASEDNRLDRVRVASPCPASWEKMSGDDAVRFCDQCQLHVYNISQMTRQQAEALISQTEGRICARIYRRTDGTILTKDCPVGLRAFRRRVARVAGAAITALLSLGASALGQTWARTSGHDAAHQQLTRTRSFLSLKPQQSRATFWGVVTDPNGDAIPGAKLTIFNKKTKYKRTIKSNDKGEFKFGLLEPGDYTFKVESPGFQNFQQEHLSLSSNQDMRFDVSLDLGGATVGIIVCEEPPSKGIVIDGVRISIND